MIGKVKGKVKSRAGDISVCLDIISYDEQGCRVNYCPALELSGYGRTKAAAEKSFMLTLHEFLDYALEHGTLAAEMTELGWTIGASGAVVPPSMKEMYTSRTELQDLISERSFTKRRSNILLPAFS